MVGFWNCITHQFINLVDGAKGQSSSERSSALATSSRLRRHTAPRVATTVNAWSLPLGLCSYMLLVPWPAPSPRAPIFGLASCLLVPALDLAHAQAKAPRAAAPNF